MVFHCRTVMAVGVMSWRAAGSPPPPAPVPSGPAAVVTAGTHHQCAAARQGLSMAEGGWRQELSTSAQCGTSPWAVCACRLLSGLTETFSEPHHSLKVLPPDLSSFPCIAFWTLILSTPAVSILQAFLTDVILFYFCNEYIQYVIYFLYYHFTFCNIWIIVIFRFHIHNGYVKIFSVWHFNFWVFSWISVIWTCLNNWEFSIGCWTLCVKTP